MYGLKDRALFTEAVVHPGFHDSRRKLLEGSKAKVNDCYLGWYCGTAEVF